MSVALVGAGPGDPGLITVRGLELLRACDAVVYDRLVAQELVDEAPEDALRICRDGLAQDAVDRLLVELGRDLDVVRLKGGDPFVFGRGGEEAIALAEAGIAVEIVPGVSSIAAVPAAAGIPVTHRGVSDRVTIATAHAADGSEPDYKRLARAGGTLVLFMGLGRLAELARGLVAAGMPASTPAAVVSRGTLPDQETVTAPLEDLPERAAGLPGPALVVVGDVVALSDRDVGFARVLRGDGFGGRGQSPRPGLGDAAEEEGAAHVAALRERGTWASPASAEATAFRDAGRAHVPV